MQYIKLHSLTVLLLFISRFFSNKCLSSLNLNLFHILIRAVISKLIEKSIVSNIIAKINKIGPHGDHHFVLGYESTSEILLATLIIVNFIKRKSDYNKNINLEV